jgi:thiol:disulfide interchange protein
MARNVVRSILGIVLAAAATWLANYLVEKIFGPEDSDLANA